MAGGYSPDDLYSSLSNKREGPSLRLIMYFDDTGNNINSEYSFNI
ncbi:MAG: hypothetical protein U0354_18105 [Candidatus Sericytochromatia bacterium]